MNRKFFGEVIFLIAHVIFSIKHSSLIFKLMTDQSIINHNKRFTWFLLYNCGSFDQKNKIKNRCNSISIRFLYEACREV